jgi:hypothetical protein
MNTLWVRIVDAHFRLIQGATVRAVTAEKGAIKLHMEEDRWVGASAPADRVTLHVSAKGFEPETHTIALRDEVTQVVIGLRQEEQLTNFVFHAHHPELEGRRIRTSERALAQEWLRIRDELVRPSLQGVQPELEEFEGIGETFEDLHDAEFVGDEPEEFPEALY